AWRQTWCHTPSCTGPPVFRWQGSTRRSSRSSPSTTMPRRPSRPRGKPRSRSCSRLSPPVSTAVSSSALSGAGSLSITSRAANTPSVVREAIVADEIACDLLPAARDLLRPSVGLGDALVGAFEDATRDLAPGSTLGLLTDAGELEDLAQIVFTSRLISSRLA